MKPIKDIDHDSVLGNVLVLISILVFVLGLILAAYGEELLFIGGGAIILSIIVFGIGSLYTISAANFELNKEMYRYLSSASTNDNPTT